MKISALTRWVAVVAVTAFSLATLLSGVAFASDDWSTGHETVNGTECHFGERYPVSGIPGSIAGTSICWSGYDVSVQGSAYDNRSDGYCAFNSIRYQVYVNGGWSGWQYRRIATACGYQVLKDSTWWWSLHPTRSLQMRACLSESSGGAVVRCDPDWH